MAADVGHSAHNLFINQSFPLMYNARVGIMQRVNVNHVNTNISECKAGCVCIGNAKNRVMNSKLSENAPPA